MNNIKVNEPLFHIVKRGKMSTKKAVLIRAIAIIIGLVFTSILCSIMVGTNPIRVLLSLFNGAFGSENKIWLLLRDTALLLTVGLALVPAFKMKFWNLGGNGQIMMGALVTIAIMRSEIGVNNQALANVLMIVCAILVGALWAVIPAIFKAFFKTNESLFTLMMNYIAVGLVSYFINEWSTNGSGVLGLIYTGHLPKILNTHLLTIIVAVIITVIIYFYMKHSKHGYEISVVGESENTAKYTGINVKLVTIRTLAISGAICGLVGLLLSGSIDHSINEQTANNMGFTAIMVAWLGKFNPLIMILTSLLISFLTRGMAQFQGDFSYIIRNKAIADIVVGIIYFVIIGCEFFITYKVVFKKDAFKGIKNFFKKLFKGKKEIVKEKIEKEDN